MQERVSSGHGPSWYIMLHLEPELIERMLRRENALRRERGLPLLRYFIPHRFLPHVRAREWCVDTPSRRAQASESNYLRSALRNFVFVRCTEPVALSLVYSDWNLQNRVRLRFYLSRSGHRLTIPDRLMGGFISLCCERRRRFSIGPPLPDVSLREHVSIRQGRFKGMEATVLDIQTSGSGLSLTLGIPLFNGEATLELPGYHPSQLQLPHRMEELLSRRFVDGVEEQLAGIIRRRLHGAETPESRLADAGTLTDLYHYSYLQLHDSPLHGQFRALMLICSSLRGDAEGIASHSAELRHMLGPSQQPPQSPEQAYLHTALYIATGDAGHRTLAKQYSQQHPDSLALLGRLLPLAKRMDRKYFRRNRRT